MFAGDCIREGVIVGYGTGSRKVVLADAGPLVMADFAVVAVDAPLPCAGEMYFQTCRRVFFGGNALRKHFIFRCSRNRPRCRR